MSNLQECRLQLPHRLLSFVGRLPPAAAKVFPFQPFGASLLATQLH